MADDLEVKIKVGEEGTPTRAQARTRASASIDADELMAIVRADSRLEGADEELVAWTQADPKVLEGVRADVRRWVCRTIGAAICCLPLFLVASLVYPCCLGNEYMERTFRLDMLRKAASHVYVLTNCSGRRAYVTVDWSTREVVWVDKSYLGPRKPPRLYRVSGDSWIRGDDTGKQVFFVLHPGEWQQGNAACVGSETRAALAESETLQIWFVALESRSFRAENTFVFMQELRRLLAEASAARVEASEPAVSKMQRLSFSDLPVAANVVAADVVAADVVESLETGLRLRLRLRVCLDGGDVSMVVVDTTSIEMFMEQLAAHLGLQPGSRLLAYMEVQGERVVLDSLGLRTLEKDDKVVVVPTGK